MSVIDEIESTDKFLTPCKMKETTDSERYGECFERYLFHSL